MAKNQDTTIAYETPLAAAINRHKAAWWAYRARPNFNPEIIDEHIAR